ncbi:TPA: hypothetical protein NH847_001376 [Pseudomonas aeruginosa]|nr:DUF6246 family protein [Pseudomonas aeruginosa]HCF1604432.1 hypothetical protein [Pseudomonas aeruginosa]
MILTEIGEIGVHTASGEFFLLRPSLYAMTQLGTPAEIVDVFARVMSDPITEKHQADQFADALAVVVACSEQDLSDVFGYYDQDLVYRTGTADVEHLVPLARCLLKHGVTGALPPLPRRHDEEPNYSGEFVAREYVATAIAHLGLSEREAWSMTMTGLIGALRAKYPPTESNAPGARAPTAAEHDATMEWFDKIEAKRKARAKGAP